jgi:transposase
LVFAAAWWVPLNVGRRAAERFGVSASSAIRWCDRIKKQGDVAAKRQVGDRKSGRVEVKADFLLGKVTATPDISSSFRKG